MTTDPSPELMKSALQGLMRLIPGGDDSKKPAAAASHTTTPTAAATKDETPVSPYPALGETHVRVVKVLAKNKSENLVISLQDFMGERWIDIRAYALSNGGSVPTKDGIKIRPAAGRKLAQGVLDAVQQADEEVTAASGKPVSGRRF